MPDISESRELKLEHVMEPCPAAYIGLQSAGKQWNIRYSSQGTLAHANQE